jgi:hypothetical protein
MNQALTKQRALRIPHRKEQKLQEQSREEQKGLGEE